MIQDKSKNLMNWEIVSVNPNEKNWNWKDLFCFWGNATQSVIGFSLVASLYLVYNLNFFIVIFGFIIAALCAALMSTADTLVNASSAIVVNDIYRPLSSKKQSEKHQLEIARYASIGVKVVAILLVPFFNSFDSISSRIREFHK